ncbi:MAG: hypothetical protein LM517_12050 [Nitrosomonas sp.]|nr:hypothetical protein [Nitrosomonas sp.]
MFNLLFKVTLIAFLCLPFLGHAGQSSNNTLWLGNNKVADLGILNVNRNGKILKRIFNTEATGIAIDTSKNLIFFGDHKGEITARDLNNPALIIKQFNPPVSVASDMAFDGKFLWRTDVGNREVQQIDPTSGLVVFSFVPDFYVIGIAWDGRYLWVSEYNGFAGNERIVQFTRDGIPTGIEFPALVVDDLVGGLAFDSTDNTLWLGARNKLYHYTTSGVLLKTVPIATSGRFIDGLEFQNITACIQQ